MELSKRLQAVADLLDSHEAIADIGCDHGFVSIYLIESKKASRCLAMDVNKGPLERAGEHIRQKRLSTYIETRLSNGAKELRFVKDTSGKMVLEAEAALIAGMGGRLMIQIIEDSLVKFQSMEEFVLQPQSEISKVREYIRTIGFYIAKEDMVWEEGKYYPMMKLVRGTGKEGTMDQIPASIKRKISEGELTKEKLQELFDFYGEFLLKERHPVLLQFLKKEQELYQDILNGLLEKETAKSEIRQKEIMEKLSFIHLGLEWFGYEV